MICKVPKLLSVFRAFHAFNAVFLSFFRLWPLREISARCSLGGHVPERLILTCFHRGFV